MGKITYLESGDRANLKVFYVFYSGNSLAASFNPPSGGEQYTRVTALNNKAAIAIVKDQGLTECLKNAVD